MKKNQQNAFNALKQQLHHDAGMAWSWHCNIAMAVVDAGTNTADDHRLGNEGAARFMRLCFDVNTSKFPEYQSFLQGWALAQKIAANLIEPGVGEVWKHHKGDRYTVLGVTSKPDAEKAEKFPRTVFYRGPDGRQWTRPLTSWTESFTFESAAAPDHQAADAERFRAIIAAAHREGAGVWNDPLISMFAYRLPHNTSFLTDDDVRRWFDGAVKTVAEKQACLSS